MSWKPRGQCFKEKVVHCVNAAERQSKNKTDVSTGFGNAKVAVDIDESSLSVLEVGVVVVGSQMEMR